MNGWDIPAVSSFVGDPRFSRSIQTWRGEEPDIAGGRPKLPRIKKEPKPRTYKPTGKRGFHARTVLVDYAEMHSFRESGNTWDQVGAAFGCTGEHARMLMLKHYPDTARTVGDANFARRPEIDTAALKEAYKRLQSFRKVGELFGCSYGTVRYRLLHEPCYFSECGDRDRKAMK